MEIQNKKARTLPTLKAWARCLTVMALIGAIGGCATTGVADVAPVAGASKADAIGQDETTRHADGIALGIGSRANAVL